MTDWTRVKDKETGHEYSTAVVRDHHEVLDKPATDRSGHPLPAKPYRPLSSLTDDAGARLASKTVAQLREHAEQHDIELGEASKKEDILTVIGAHQGTATPAA